MRILSFAILATLISCKDGSDTDTSDTSAGDADGDGLVGEADCDDTDESVGGPVAWYGDADADGFGDATTAQSACEAPLGFVADATDCDDALQDVHPGAGELCNGIDDDCDEAVDEEVDLPTWFADADADSYGNPDVSVEACEAPEGYVADGTDCDDASADWHPGATEDDCADPNDYNCDGTVGYADADADGYAACADCDDANPSANPAIPEICNDIDDDCDGTTDEADAGDASTWYVDADADGFGDATVATLVQCDAPAGHVTASGDCDDADASYHPGADEACDQPEDLNCDGSTGYADADGDGFAACLDCDDAVASVNPDGVETCDGVDQDCNGTVDDDYATDAPTWHIDADSDGHGDPEIAAVTCAAPAGYVESADDCDDADAAFHPGADESDCADPSDYNCDGSVAYENLDGDAFAACEDCDDGDADVRPDGTEVCNTVDDDCDGIVDEGDARDAATWYRDVDGDGFGDAASAYASCEKPIGYVDNDRDCDDADATLHPSTQWWTDADGDGFGDAGTLAVQCEAPTRGVRNGDDCDDTRASVSPSGAEVCNDLDDDCDGTVDDDATGSATWYADADADGYGDAGSGVTTCARPSGYVASSTDCDDAVGTTFPGASEACNLEDDDCNGTVDDDYATDALQWYEDVDGDGHGRAASTALACEMPSGYVPAGDDCDDARDDVSPSAVEVCDDANADEDCDGSADDADATVSSASKSTFWADGDSDGYGGTSASTTRCDALSGYAATGDDCDDADAYVYPSAPELCDGAYNDCSTAASWTADREDGTVSSVSSAGAWTDHTPTVGAGTASSPALYTASSGETTYFCDGTYYTRVTIPYGSTGVSLVGRNGAAGTILDAGSTGTVVTINSATAKLEDLTITGGKTGTSGGGINSSSSALTLEGVVVTANTASQDGGGMYVTGGASTTTITGSEFSDNTVESSTSAGAGLYHTSSTMTDIATLSISDTTFADNVVYPAASTGAGGSAGGLYTSYTASTIDGSTFSGNKAGVGGGAYFGTSSAPTVTDTTFAGNTAAASNGTGGAAYHSHTGDTGSYDGCTFSSNKATEKGGAIYHAAGKIDVSDSEFTSNGTTSATVGSGGAIHLAASSTISGSTFESNASRDGGAVYVASGNSSTLSSSVFTSNSGTSGGALRLLGSTTATGLTVTGNTSSGNGGGILASAIYTLTSSTVSGNRAGTSGGGLYQSGGSVTLSGTTVSDNTATVFGGGIYQSASTVTAQAGSSIDGNLLTGTATAVYGGGWYVSGSTAVATLDASTLTDNIVHTTGAGDAFGGGIALQGGASFKCTDGTVSGNAVSTEGSGRTYGGGVFGFFTSATSTFTIKVTSTGCDWAAGTENSPDDAYFLSTTPLSYDATATVDFTCSQTTGSASCL